MDEVLATSYEIVAYNASGIVQRFLTFLIHFLQVLRKDKFFISYLFISSDLLGDCGRRLICLPKLFWGGSGMRAGAGAGLVAA